MLHCFCPEEGHIRMGKHGQSCLQPRVSCIIDGKEQVKFWKFHQASTYRSLPIHRAFGRSRKLWCGRSELRHSRFRLRRRRAIKIWLLRPLASQFWIYLKFGSPPLLMVLVHILQLFFFFFGFSKWWPYVSAPWPVLPYLGLCHW